MRALLIASLAAATGCAVPAAGGNGAAAVAQRDAAAWSRAPRHADAPVEGDGWSLRFPDGWRRLKDRSGASATRLGDRVQRIDVRVFPDDDEPLRSAAPAEAARALHARAARAPAGEEPVVVAAASATLADLPGVRAELTLRDAKGLAVRAVLHCGRGAERWHCLVYHAAALRYFERGLAEFDQAVSSFRLTPRRDTGSAAEGAL